ncbi:MAG: YDG domain-containing protein, partial [Bacteroidota bacterium]|nr:YDG domain-containing protein [Bacteroidota bacterium]
ATFAQADKGDNIPITISLMKLKGSDSDNYTLQQPSGLTANITAKPLIVTGAVAQDKIYDGNDLAQITGATLEGVVYPDEVMLVNQRTGRFAQKEKGKRIEVSSGMTLVGADANNYTLVQPSGLSADITPKPLTVSGAVAQDKIYDGTVIAQISGAILEGVISPDVVSLGGTGLFSQKEVGTAIRITGMTITGKDSANYVLVLPENLKANILPRTLTVSGATAQDKIYDGNNIARITGAFLTGTVNSDDVSLTGTGSFSQKQVGEHVRVTDLSMTGRDAGNYRLAQPEGLSANISAKPLTIRGTFAQNKIYDGNATAQIGGSQLEGVISTDDVSLVEQITGTFAQKDKGINIPVSILPMTITGADSENYTLLQPEGLSANIIAKQLKISVPTVINHKMYDGNTTAIITDFGVLEGVESVDVNNVSVSATANYDNANVGNNKTITVVYGLSGNAMSNYKAPVDYVMSGARISDYITLAPISAPTAGCEGYDLDLTYTVLTGSPTQYKITFDQTAISAGFQNISYRDLSSPGNTGVLSMAIPAGMPDGRYTATLQMRNELGEKSIPYSFSFTINLSSDYVIPKFDDMLICDNSSNRFRAYQWYKNGIAIDGATSQFYTDTEGLVGDYSLKVWTADGQELLTCSKTLDIPLNSKKLVSVYPNPLKQSTQNSTVEISGFSEKELQGAQMTVYDIKGIPVYATGSLTRINTLSLPHAVGFYVGRITFVGGKEHMFKILVAE